ncbi:GNAT family N-acetyltransferase [Roseovarius sp. SCSIO 43702]|uniref:GNAT family N-acetyltransferase n=1 Tax=Roseovarius sp. SCSIO 43702 TaxID=2823043 RepID=UPI001C733BD9|nr:GNAT family N-acetyltransferase [Roseovarius sp. SCSIO 43702]QYX58199.1 GNAT family N-acetyltransferase [Roseovarius sp. SCSIO 43702]
MGDHDELTIRPAREGDFEALWPILRDVIRAGETYAIDPHLSQDRIRAFWMETPRATYVAERAGEILGTYYIKTNAQGGGAHVCNCGYMTSAAARGRGVARAMCRHSQDEARRLGYLAMQFNCVVETNAGAIRLWESEGFETVGRLPDTFQHPEQGFVSARVMFKWLGERG